MADDLPPPLLTPLAEFLRDIGRSYGWYRDHQHDPDYDPQVPPLVKQDRNNFILTADAERYKRDLLRRAGIRTVGRPRKNDPPATPTT